MVSELMLRLLANHLLVAGTKWLSKIYLQSKAKQMIYMTNKQQDISEVVAN